MWSRFGEVGANFSLQLSKHSQFSKIKNRNVMAKNQCEKHERMSLVGDSPETLCYVLEEVILSTVWVR